MRISPIEMVPLPHLRETAVVTLHGPLDATNVTALKTLILSPRERAIRIVILDLVDVRYINSMGMAYLVNLSDLLQERKGALHLANPQPKVKVILELMGLTTIFRLHGSIAQAVSAIRTGKPSVSPGTRGRSRSAKTPATSG